MANIISYFTKNTALSLSTGLEIYDFTGNATTFVKDCELRFREAYISDEMLTRIVANSKKTTRKDAIERRLPTKTEIIAGDFGEILSYYLWTETFASDANICPIKIRWKENPDVPSHGVDVILLKKVDKDNASKDDKIYTIESKVWSSRMKNGHSSLTDALDGAVKDKTERAAKTIPYLVTQYERDGEFDLADQVQRFGDPVNTPYIKEHFAIAMVESSQAETHISNIDKALQKANPNIPVYLLPITNLKNIYKNLFHNIPNN
ncbi:MAG: DUF1837 domain-containing protein [Paludibacteraceae bacterium]|nr:DUF1837 domain-containing protein [Paludibacteraceae bacterium]